VPTYPLAEESRDRPHRAGELYAMLPDRAIGSLAAWLSSRP